MLVYFLLIISTLLSHFCNIECNNDCSKTICNPRAGDLLIGRESFLRASSTCGLNNIERYCIFTPSDSGRRSKCNICYSKDPYQKFSASYSHRIENVVSRLPQDSNRWWQSVNGVHNVSIEIAFESEFQFTFTHLRFKTYRPAAMYIERSKDYGRSWDKYAYFSENCARDFPSIPERKRNNINEVLCTSEFSSIIPSEGGTVLFSADTSDWINNDVFWNKKRNDITAITNLRVQFVRLHTFGDWKLDDNPNIRNKYYYAVSEWIIRGRCSCYGHASKCKAKEGQLQIKEMVYGVCECQHNTEGQHCDKCKDFYNDSPWLPADKNSTNECRKCNCNNHSVSCHFSSSLYEHSNKKSGGVCDNCQHNTESTKCEKCKIGYYRNSLVSITSPETCLKCQCDSLGTKFPNNCIQESESDRNVVAGQCMCKENVEGNNCDRCKVGYWKFNGNEETGCIKCNCVMIGTIKNKGCDDFSGKCYCKEFVTESDCSSCKTGYFNLTAFNPYGCSLCKCSEYGALNSICDKYSGQCLCKPGYTGKRCNEIKAGWYVEEPRYPLNNKEHIKIELPPVSKSGYYNFIITMDTQQMQISDSYVIGLEIKHTLKSSCSSYENTMKLMKDSKYIVIPNQCLEKDLPITITVVVMEQPIEVFLPPAIIDITVIPLLDVNSTKTRNVLANCLNYKQQTTTKKCDFLTTEISSKIVAKSEPLKCNCNVTGSVNNICNKIGGKCHCLPNVSGKNCDQCATNTYGFDARGCKSCNCDLSGSLNPQCSRDTGKCLCRDGVEGQHCDSCKSGYWNFPFCDQCKCNQMSDLCDSKTGKCLNCKGNSFGFNCQQCQNGYYGDTSRRIPCVKCECPGLSNGRNNSVGCSLIFNTTTFVCICKPGYSGRFCDSCDVNYFGNPISKDGSCRPCKCSENINKLIPNSCDPNTGECTKCLYHTAGFNCEKCSSGYFGNALTRTCKKCVCNNLGTNSNLNEICNHETGKCPCLPNVIGQQCDRCQDNYFNISSKIGCLQCECDFPFGAVNQSCNQLTGQCYCHSTRSGLKCNNCQDGYWGDPKTIQGCQMCTCNAEGSQYKQCNRNTGVCRCKPGITGRNCNECMKGTDGKMPYCSSCGDCWFQWDRIIGTNEISVSNLSNSSFINLTSIKYPEELNAIFSSIDEIVKLFKNVENFFPNGYNKKFNKIELKLSALKNIFRKMNITNFDINQNSISAIENSTDETKNSVSRNKIKDVKGAYSEIINSLKSVRVNLNESKELSMKIDFMNKNLNIKNSELKAIDIDFINNKNDELMALKKDLKGSLDAFNGVTCNGKSNSNCSLLCGGVGCPPDLCYRQYPINPYCLKTNITFFNKLAWLIEANINRFDSLLNNMTKETSNILNSEEIKVLYNKAESERKDTVILISLVENVITIRHSKVLEVLENVKRSSNSSVNEKDFKSLLEKINKFELSFKENEITALEKEIFNRKNKLTDVNDILERSEFNRKNCDMLKKSAIEAKKNTNYLFNSIKNIRKHNENSQNYTQKSNELLLNITNSQMNLKKNLSKISNIKMESEEKQANISITINKMKSFESKIKETLNDFSNSLKQIKNSQSKRIKSLQTLKEKLAIAEKNKTDSTKLGETSNEEVSQAFQTLISKINDIDEKIKIGIQKLKDAKNGILTKESNIQDISKEIDSKLANLVQLQDRIYSKSEYHAGCLP